MCVIQKYRPSAKSDHGQIPGKKEASSAKISSLSSTEHIIFQEEQEDGTVITKQEENSPSIIIITILALLALFAFHCTWITSSAYSSPSIVLATGGQGP